MRNTYSEYDDIDNFLNEFNKESDRGAALIAASILDEKLLYILKAFFIDNKTSNELIEGVNAPLGTFSARLLAAYNLGLIQDNEFKEINIIRKIRNEFSHKWKGIDFTTQKIYNLCMQLPWLGPNEYEKEHGKDARQRFNFEIAILALDLVWRPILVKREKRVIKLWPNKMR